MRDLDLTSHATMYEMSQQNQALNAVIKDNQAALAATAGELDAMQMEIARRASQICRKAVDGLAKVRQISHELLVKIQALHEKKMENQQSIARDREGQLHLTIADLRAKHAEQLAEEASKQTVQQRYTFAINQEQEAKIANLSKELFVKSIALNELRAVNHQNERRAVNMADAAIQTSKGDFEGSDGQLLNRPDLSDVYRAKSSAIGDFVQGDDPEQVRGAKVPLEPLDAAPSRQRTSLWSTVDLLEQISN